jgi:glycosyltransferase involved in cell wall biosynthesis
MSVRELSVFFPCFDEEANVETTVERALAVLRGRDLDRFEVIVVDDGSRDRTGALADGLAERIDEVRVVHHVQNQGYGAALRSGFDAAELPWIFFTDGDGQFHLDEIDAFLEAADAAEVVIGYRLERADHFGRRVNTWLWGFVVRCLFNLRVHDIDCAFKLLSRDALDRIGPLAASGAVISTELLAGVRRERIPMIEIGVNHYPRQAGSPTGASPRVILRALRELVDLRTRDWREARAARRA